MKIPDNIISFLKRLGQRQTQKTKLPPESLSPEIMSKVMEEVDFLRSEHAVDVRNLEKGEIPTLPKRAE